MQKTPLRTNQCKSQKVRLCCANLRISQLPLFCKNCESNILPFILFFYISENSKLYCQIHIGLTEKTIVAGEGLGDDLWHSVKWQRRGMTITFGVDDERPLIGTIYFSLSIQSQSAFTCTRWKLLAAKLKLLALSQSYTRFRILIALIVVAYSQITVGMTLF